LNERTSFENGIWLCQSCGKLVDNDPEAFTVALLRQWKEQAEAKALNAVSGSMREDLPQPTAAKHTPLPRIRSLPYDLARTRLINNGWHPALRHWSEANDPDISLGNGPYYWRKGYQEILSACPTGTASCVFAFRDAYGHALQVITEGEADSETGSEAAVMSWHNADALQTSTTAAALAGLPRKAIEIARLPTPPNVLESVEVGTPSAKVRERLGVPDLALGSTWQYRFADTQVEVAFDSAQSVQSVVIALVHDFKYEALDAPFGDFVLGEITVHDLIEMGHLHVMYRDSMRTRELIVPVRTGPAGAWTECFFGALVVHSGVGALAETDFLWDFQTEQLKSPAADTRLNWVGIGGTALEPPYFSWYIKG
jgi:hypothetical protein